jgi:hypothetical protein
MVGSGFKEIDERDRWREVDGERWIERSGWREVD